MRAVRVESYPGRMMFFFFNDTATTEIYTLSLHDALPIFFSLVMLTSMSSGREFSPTIMPSYTSVPGASRRRSEEHTSELQSRQYLVCRLLLEKKKGHRRSVAHPRPHQHRQTVPAKPRDRL